MILSTIFKHKTSLTLKEFTEGASAILFGRLFHAVTIRLRRNWALGSLSLVITVRDVFGDLSQYIILITSADLLYIMGKFVNLDEFISFFSCL